MATTAADATSNTPLASNAPLESLSAEEMNALKYFEIVKDTLKNSYPELSGDVTAENLEDAGLYSDKPDRLKKIAALVKIIEKNNRIKTVSTQAIALNANATVTPNAAATANAAATTAITAASATPAAPPTLSSVTTYINPNPSLVGDIPETATSTANSPKGVPQEELEPPPAPRGKSKSSRPQPLSDKSSPLMDRQPYPSLPPAAAASPYPQLTPPARVLTAAINTHPLLDAGSPNFAMNPPAVSSTANSTVSPTTLDAHRLASQRVSDINRVNHSGRIASSSHQRMQLAAVLSRLTPSQMNEVGLSATEAATAEKLQLIQMEREMDSVLNQLKGIQEQYAIPQLRDQFMELHRTVAAWKTNIKSLQARSAQSRTAKAIMHQQNPMGNMFAAFASGFPSTTVSPACSVASSPSFAANPYLNNTMVTPNNSVSVGANHVTGSYTPLGRPPLPVLPAALPLLPAAPTLYAPMYASSLSNGSSPTTSANSSAYSSPSASVYEASSATVTPVTSVSSLPPASTN